MKSKYLFVVMAVWTLNAKAQVIDLEPFAKANFKQSEIITDSTYVDDDNNPDNSLLKIKTVVMVEAEQVMAMETLQSVEGITITEFTLSGEYGGPEIEIKGNIFNDKIKNYIRKMATKGESMVFYNVYGRLKDGTYVNFPELIIHLKEKN
jgi:hypothetical protein